jgi:hypothetical protein
MLKPFLRKEKVFFHNFLLFDDAKRPFYKLNLVLAYSQSLQFNIELKTILVFFN